MQASPYPKRNEITDRIGMAMLEATAMCSHSTEIVLGGLKELSLACELSVAMVVNQRGKDWHLTSSTGPIDAVPADAIPVELVSEAVDGNRIARAGNQLAIPVNFTDAIATHTFAPHALVLNTTERTPQQQLTDALPRLSTTFAIGLHIATRWTQITRHVGQLAEMLKIGAQWSREEDVGDLLEAIAAAATRLLGAERASIFLWDQARGKLVGRPALGVDGNVLEVEDSAGIVGAVLSSGLAKRWHAGEDVEAEVNRSVDMKLRFETRSLLAVPMWEIQQGNVSAARWIPKPIGVFEVINCLQGKFTVDDERFLAELATQASAAIQSTQLRQRLIANRDRLVDSAAASANVVGDHASMVAVRTTAARVAETDLSVLILGENGTGKEVLARSIHFGSPRKHEPFIAVNCAALVETLLESELFGHEKGAFTDAHQTRQGKFELADGGTLFLDEVGDLSAGGQAKLLRVLEEKKIVRVGGSQLIPVDVRVIAATNQPLVEMVKNKRFREDLFFRLNIVTLNLPPLRQRGGDIITLAEHFLASFSQQVGRKVPSLSPAAKSELMNYSWPGNIRELRNLMERLSYLCPGEVIHQEDLALHTNSFDVRARDSTAGPVEFDGRSLADATRGFQIYHIENAISQSSGNMTDAAHRLGLHRSNLYRKMKQLGMEINDESA